MDKKKSISNIQDLCLSAASQQSIGRQPKPVVYFWIFLIFRFFNLFLVLKKIIFRKFYVQDIDWQPIHSTSSRYRQSFKKSINKHFVHN
jgi:hypothetical protein